MLTAEKQVNGYAKNVEDKREPLGVQLSHLDEEGLASGETSRQPNSEETQYAGSLATAEVVERTRDSIAAVTDGRRPAPRVLRGVMAEIRRQGKVRRNSTPRTVV